MHLEVRHLQLVAAIADEQTLTAAANRLHISQSAASQALAQLERRLATRLFSRGRGGLRITPEGRRILQASRRVLAELRRAEADVQRLAEGTLGRIRLATECFTCYHWVPEIFRRFQAEWPGVEVSLRPEMSSRLLAALADDELDLALMYRPPQDSRFAARLVLRDEIVALVGSDHAWSRRCHVEAQDFPREVVLAHSQFAESPVHERVLAPVGALPSRVLELQLTEAIVAAARAGLGVGILADWAARPHLAAGDLKAVRIGPQGVHRTWHAVTTEPLERAPLQRLISLLATGPAAASPGGAT